MNAGMKTITLYSSHGEATFCAETGYLISGDFDTDEWPRENHPHKLDLEEWKKAYPGEEAEGHHDILDWGYTTNGGQLVPPEEEWRKDFRRNRDEENARRKRQKEETDHGS